MTDPYTLYATDAEITELQTRWRAAVNPQAHQPKDCRTCKWFHQPGDSQIPGCFSHGKCVNADQYQPTAYVQLWRMK